MYSSQNWVHHHTWGPHNYVREQMHAYRPVDETTARRHSADTHSNPATVPHRHGRQHCCNLLGGRSCALHPPSAMLTHNPIAPERPRMKLRIRNHPRPHSPAYHTPPTTIDGNRRRPHATTPPRCPIYTHTAIGNPTSLFRRRLPRTHQRSMLGTRHVLLRSPGRHAHRDNVNRRHRCLPRTIIPQHAICICGLHL